MLISFSNAQSPVEPYTGLFEETDQRFRRQWAFGCCGVRRGHNDSATVP